MANSALSQDEINLLLNGSIPEQEDMLKPDNKAKAILPAEDKQIMVEAVDVRLPGPAGQTSRANIETRASDYKKVPVQTVQFMPFGMGSSQKEGEVNKMELIYDVGLQLTVELGRTEKTLKEILEIGPGSIVGLDKLAGETLDILVNGKLLARGEVIIIDENYGVRIKEILSSREGIGGLKS